MELLRGLSSQTHRTLTLEMKYPIDLDYDAMSKQEHDHYGWRALLLGLRLQHAAGLDGHWLLPRHQRLVSSTCPRPDRSLFAACIGVSRMRGSISPITRCGTKWRQVTISVVWRS